MKILEIDWLGSNLESFFPFLSTLRFHEFDNALLKVILEQQRYSTQLFFKIFIPYVVYMCASLTYFSHFLPINTIQGGFFGEPGFRVQAGCRITIFLGAFLFLSIELNQLRHSNIFDYLKDFWNYVYWVSNSIALWVVIDHSIVKKMEIKDLVSMGSISIVGQWLMLFYWLRLFEGMSFYVKLIVETVADLTNFMVMFIMLNLMFANAVYALN